MTEPETAPPVRRADPAESRKLAATLARAFFDDPFARWAQPDDDARGPTLEKMFCAMFEEVFDESRETITTADLDTAAVWAAPGDWPASPEQEERIGRRMVELYGSAIRHVGMALEVIEGEKHPEEPHWYLEFLGTDPDRQGQGLASAVLAPVLARCDAHDIGAYLWTAREANLGFYGRHGFEVSWSWDIPEGPPVWGMWRGARVRRGG